MELDNKSNFNNQELWRAPEPKEHVAKLLNDVVEREDNTECIYELTWIQEQF